MIPVILLSSMLTGISFAVLAAMSGAPVPVVVAGYSLGGVLILTAILVSAMLQEVEGEPVPKPQASCGDPDFPSADCASRIGNLGECSSPNSLHFFTARVEASAPSGLRSTPTASFSDGDRFRLAEPALIDQPANFFTAEASERDERKNLGYTALRKRKHMPALAAVRDSGRQSGMR